jgi:hypothetical protein
VVGREGRLETSTRICPAGRGHGGLVGSRLPVVIELSEDATATSITELTKAA